MICTHTNKTTTFCFMKIHRQIKILCNIDSFGLKYTLCTVQMHKYASTEFGQMYLNGLFLSN